MKKTITTIALVAAALSGCTYNAQQFQEADPSASFADVNCEAIYKEGTFPYKEHVLEFDLIKVDSFGRIDYRILPNHKVKFLGESLVRSTNFTKIWCPEKDLPTLQKQLDISRERGRTLDIVNEGQTDKPIK